MMMMVLLNLPSPHPRTPPRPWQPLLHHLQRNPHLLSSVSPIPPAMPTVCCTHDDVCSFLVRSSTSSAAGLPPPAPVMSMTSMMPSPRDDVSPFHDGLNRLLHLFAASQHTKPLRLSFSPHNKPPTNLTAKKQHLSLSLSHTQSKL